MGENESFPMIGGDGAYSYAKNSSPQKEAGDLAKAMLIAAVSENLDIVHGSPTSNTFRIADLGCSVGPNTFIAVNNIIEGIEQKYQADDEGHNNSCPLEFQVFFNDHVSNDFNTLFINLNPSSYKKYFAAGVPGPFHGRLFPKASINFFYSSFALQWLSKVPPQVCDRNSPCFNKGRILYANAPKEVGEAYSAQFAKDMEIFLGARAQELAPGGLMAFLIPCQENGTDKAQSPLGLYFQTLESGLVDMANEGILSEDELDSFNLPIYSPSADELEKLIQKNGCFDIARVEEMQTQSISLCSMEECRAGLGEIIKTHFGSEILDQLFDRYAKKIAGCPSIISCDAIGIGIGTGFFLLKRKY